MPTNRPAQVVRQLAVVTLAGRSIAIEAVQGSSGYRDLRVSQTRDGAGRSAQFITIPGVHVELLAAAIDDFLAERSRYVSAKHAVMARDGVQAAPSARREVDRGR